MPLDTGNNVDDVSYEDSSSSSFYHNPWPCISPSQQLQIQNRYFEDGATIHFDRLRGLQSWAPLVSFSDEFRVAFVLKEVVGAAQKAQRRLTAEEADALSGYADDYVRKLVWIRPAAVVVAAAVAVSTRRTFRFPFYQPKMQSFDPYHFPRAAFPLFKGTRAAATWHFLRFLAYYPFAWFNSAVFFTSVADLSFQAHMSRDARLTTIVKDFRSAAKAPGAHSGASQHSLPEGRVDYSDSQVPPIPQSQQYSQSQAAGSNTASAPRQAPWGTSQAPAQTSADWDADPFEDDASPVAAAARHAEAAHGQSSNSGSSWARLRQQAQSETSSFAKGDSSGRERGWAQLRQDKAPGTAEGPRGTAQYSYSQQDEDRENKNYEKEQAQKEFDALLEAERRGESSSSRKR